MEDGGVVVKTGVTIALFSEDRAWRDCRDLICRHFLAPCFMFHV